MIATQAGQSKKRIGLISTGIVGALLVAFTFTPTFAGFAASIQNTINSASTGTLTMKETSGTYTCNSTDGAGATTNSATCSTINKYGGKLPDAVGIPEEQLRKASKSAVCKINIDSDSRLAFTAAVRKVFAEQPAEFDPRKYCGPARDLMTELYKHKIKEVLGSDNKLAQLD